MAIDWIDVKMELSSAGREDLARFVHAKLEDTYDARLERMTAAALTGLLSNPVTGNGMMWELADEWVKETASLSVEFAAATCMALDKDRVGGELNLTDISNSLPHGWKIQIDLQKGSHCVTIFGPCDDMYEPDSGNGIDADIEMAVRFACFHDAEQDRKVNVELGRFSKEVEK